MDISESLFLLTQRSGQLYFSYQLADQQLTYYNPAFERFFDLSKTTPTIPLLLAMVHPEDQEYVIEKFKECLEQNIIENMECRIVRGNELRHLRFSAITASDTVGQLLIGHAEDITATKSQIGVISKHNAKKNSILSILSHDLAGPIGVIQNLSDLLRMEAPEQQSVKANKYISMVNKISKSCIKLIRDFMDHEFLESAGVNLVKKRVNLIEKLKNQTEQYLRYQTELNKEITFTFNQVEIYIEIDEDKFLQVINNLLSNALKFTQDGGKITITAEEQQHCVIIKIADNGIGIPRKYHATLFEKFSEARRTGLKGERSTGLGMSIIKTIIEWHDGKIWFESIENQGTTFYIELPK